MLKIRFYGKLREIFGESIEVEGKFKNIEELANFLAEKEKNVEKLKDYLLFSINKKQADFKDKINDGDEIAIFVTPTGG
ncbi:MAG TPA: hypothetical protein ENI33_01470 [Thermoplasmatales archaeon]|nr:hypothetical protein [Thermoplasmatales archaeon]